MPNLVEGLNEEQASAVLSDADRILMLAGAGTGKTRTLTHRLAHLNLNCRTGSSSIVAITFTRAAAKEMKDRLIPLIGETEAKKIICCTFHALAVRILKEWGHRIGIDNQFTIYSQEDRAEVIKTIINKFGYKTSLNKVLATRDVVDMSQESLVWNEYQYNLKRFNAIDLDNLITKVNILFAAHQDVATYYQNMWKYVFVDEFQDTDGEQLQLIQRLNPANLFVIGDDFQAIYGWRGARVENILEFPLTFEGTQVIKLEQNYRSTKAIIEAANNLIAHNFNQTEKSLFPNKEGVLITTESLLDQEYETQSIISTIESKLLNKNYQYSDFAVLARTNHQVDTVYQELKHAGIPTMILSSKDDPLRKNDIKSLISYMDFIYNPRDAVNFKRILGFPEPSLTDLQLQQLEQISIDQSISLREAMDHMKEDRVTRFKEKVNRLYEMLIDQQDAAQSFTDLYKELRLADVYEERMLEHRKDELFDAEIYIQHWSERQQNMGEDHSPTAFLRWIKMRDIQEKLMEERDCVKLMTIHGSKGLEFDTVFLIGMNEDIFPSQNTRDMEEERRLAYVAVTRAKNNLYITSTQKYISSWGKERELPPSRFLEEMKRRRNEACSIV